MGLFRRRAAPSRPAAPPRRTTRAPLEGPPLAPRGDALSYFTQAKPYRPKRGQWDIRPGAVVWGPVKFMESDAVEKDRPVLVVGREGDILLVLTLSTQAKHGQHAEWYPLGAGAWDRQGRPSWTRLHPWYRMRAKDVRRWGGLVDAATFEGVKDALVRRYGWTFPRG
ncbi:MAG TPA: hypothetical protein VGX28_08555 [Frankiaceae bacterium]|jgi:hypothetical protein|nr:hypothetical protein [Frankiaceae bacterium]